MLYTVQHCGKRNRDAPGWVALVVFLHSLLLSFGLCSLSSVGPSSAPINVVCIFTAGPRQGIP